MVPLILNDQIMNSEILNTPLNPLSRGDFRSSTNNDSSFIIQYSLFIDYFASTLWR